VPALLRNALVYRLEMASAPSLTFVSKDYIAQHKAVRLPTMIELGKELFAALLPARSTAVKKFKLGQSPHAQARVLCAMDAVSA
jgi:hypothetical protein